MSDALWGSLFGGGCALFGVLITTIFNLWRESANRKEERRREQARTELAMRRDIYIPASKAISTLQCMIVQYPNADISGPDFLMRYQEAVNHLSPVYLVASISTVEALIDLSAKIQDVFRALTIKKIELGGVEARLRVVEDNFKHTHLVIRDLNTKISHLRADNVDASIVQSHNDEVGRLLESAEKLGGEANVLRNQRGSMQFELQRLASEGIVKIGIVATRAALASRREMGIHVDEKRFRASLLASYKRVVAGNLEHLDEVEKWLNDAMNEPMQGGSPAETELSPKA